jgi:hypothetical protein
MTFNEREDIGNIKKQQIAICGKLALEESVDLSVDIVQNKRRNFVYRIIYYITLYYIILYYIILYSFFGPVS